MDDKIKEVKVVIEKQLEEISKLSGVNSLILSVCLVDTITGFYGGYFGQKNGNKERFLNFTIKYLPEYSDNLYDIRCNLAHSFTNTISNFLFVDNSDFTKAFSDIQTILNWKVFDIVKMRGALQKAINNYFEDLSNPENADIRNNFCARYDKLNILKEQTIPTITNMKGEIVSKYDDLDTLPGTDIKIASYNPIKGKK